LGRRRGQFKAEKRRKELKRLAKQNAKLKRKQAKQENGGEAVDELDSSKAPEEGVSEEGTPAEGAVDEQE
jgi:hypothetical protein